MPVLSPKPLRRSLLPPPDATVLNHNVVFEPLTIDLDLTEANQLTIHDRPPDESYPLALTSCLVVLARRHFSFHNKGHDNRDVDHRGRARGRISSSASMAGGWRLHRHICRSQRSVPARLDRPRRREGLPALRQVARPGLYAYVPARGAPLAASTPAYRRPLIRLSPSGLHSVRADQ